MTDFSSHPDWLAHLAGIIAHPEDDLRRLVLADWLEERDGEVECRRCRGTGKRIKPGQYGATDRFVYERCCDCHGTGRVPNGFSERAEFIRVQIELANSPLRPDSGREHLTRVAALRRRERELWDYGPVRQWFGVVGQDVNLGIDTYGLQASSRPSFVVRRGFVDEVRCTLATFVGGVCERCEGHPGRIPVNQYSTKQCPDCKGTGQVQGVGRAVCAAHPVERVAVGDREPAALRGGVFAWAAKPSTFADAAELPADLVRRSPHLAGDHPTREAALAALSDTLIALARA